MPVTRRYYSARTGKNPLASSLDLAMFLRLFRDVFIEFDSRHYFQEAFGYICVDQGPVAGTLGSDVEATVFRKLRKPDLWPVGDKCASYSEDDVFDVIEFLYD